MAAHLVPAAAWSPANPLEDLSKAAVDTGVAYMHKVGQMIGASTTFDPSMDWFLNQYSRAFAIALFLMAGVLLWTVVTSTRAGADGADAFAAAFGRLPLAFLLAAFTPGIALLLSTLTDQVTGLVTLGMEDNARQFLNTVLKFTSDMSPNDVTGGVGTMLVVGFVMTICGLFLLAELVVRSAGLYLGALFAPFLFSALINRRLWPAVRRPVSVWLALLLSKPVIAMCLAAMWAAGASTHSVVDGNGHQVVSDRASSLMFALVAALLASVALPVLWHFVPLLGDHLQQLQWARRGTAQSIPTRAVTAPSQIVAGAIDTRMARSMERARRRRAEERPPPRLPLPSERTGWDGRPSGERTDSPTAGGPARPAAPPSRLPPPPGFPGPPWRLGENPLRRRDFPPPNPGDRQGPA
jgi:hypothetical protein